MCTLHKTHTHRCRPQAVFSTAGLLAAVHFTLSGDQAWCIFWRQTGMNPILRLGLVWLCCGSAVVPVRSERAQCARGRKAHGETDVGGAVAAAVGVQLRWKSCLETS